MWMIFPRQKFNALLLCLNLCTCECCSMSVTFSSLFWQIWGCLPEGKMEESWWEKSGRVHADFVLWTPYFVEVNTGYFFRIPFGNHINHSLFCSDSVCCLPKVSAHTPRHKRNYIFSFPLYCTFMNVMFSHALPIIWFVKYIRVSLRIVFVRKCDLLQTSVKCSLCGEEAAQSSCPQGQQGLFLFPSLPLWDILTLGPINSNDLNFMFLFKHCLNTSITSNLH